jgi:hypothetical protein
LKTSENPPLLRVSLRHCSSVGLVVDQRPAHSPVAWVRSLVATKIFLVNIHKNTKKINVWGAGKPSTYFERSGTYTSPNVELPEIKKNKKNNYISTKLIMWRVIKKKIISKSCMPCQYMCEDRTSLKKDVSFLSYELVCINIIVLWARKKYFNNFSYLKHKKDSFLISIHTFLYIKTINYKNCIKLCPVVYIYKRYICFCNAMAILCCCSQESLLYRTERRRKLDYTYSIPDKLILVWEK